MQVSLKRVDLPRPNLAGIAAVIYLEFDVSIRKCQIVWFVNRYNILPYSQLTMRVL